MNWKAIKHIYIQVLVRNYKIEYLGGDKYRLISYYSSGQKSWEKEYQDGKLHGKYISWYENGNKYWEKEYQNGKQHGKSIGWYENGQRYWENEYQNGKLIK